MADKPRNITPSKGGVFHDFTDRIRLILRLMTDKRISPMLKLLPFGAMIYLFLPDLAPGPLDDALILWLGSTVFVELCPQEVVSEHEEDLRQVIAGESRDPDSGDVIDGDVRDLE
jgi:hypothetical protein